MIVIRFPSADCKRAALIALAGRFNFKSWATGKMLVPADALPFLALRGVRFNVEGPATYDLYVHDEAMAIDVKPGKNVGR